jgi:hypothetical protein
LIKFNLRGFCQTRDEFKTIAWSLKFINHTKQIDSYNCGVFVMIFMKKIKEHQNFRKLNLIEFSNKKSDLLKIRKEINSFFQYHSVKNQLNN